MRSFQKALQLSQGEKAILHTKFPGLCLDPKDGLSMMGNAVLNKDVEAVKIREKVGQVLLRKFKRSRPLGARSIAHTQMKKLIKHC